MSGTPKTESAHRIDITMPAGDDEGIRLATTLLAGGPVRDG
jgi:hypothetical protein